MNATPATRRGTIATAVLLLATPLLTGCSGDPELRTSRSISVEFDLKRSDAPTVGVWAWSRERRHDDEVQMLCSQLVRELERSGQFGHVTNLLVRPGAIIDLELEIEVMDVVRVDFMERLTHGGVQGFALLETVLRARDVVSGRILGEARLKSTSEADSIEAATTAQQIRSIAANMRQVLR